MCHAYMPGNRRSGHMLAQSTNRAGADAPQPRQPKIIAKGQPQLHRVSLPTRSQYLGGQHSVGREAGEFDDTALPRIGDAPCKAPRVEKPFQSKLHSEFPLPSRLANYRCAEAECNRTGGRTVQQAGPVRPPGAWQGFGSSGRGRFKECSTSFQLEGPSPG